MLSVSVAGGACAAMVVCGVVGLLLQKALPEAHTSDRSRDIIGGVVGLLTLLLALVLGLLIWTAFGVTNTQKTELQLLSARALEFDLEMKQYGPEGDPGRELLRTEIVWAHEQFWGDSDAMAAAYEASYKNMGSMNAFLGALKPATDMQRGLLAAASQHYGAIGETRLLMSLQLSDPISWPLIITVIAWSCLLFLGFGLLSRMNATTLAALALGAASVASAVFLILELSQPYTSLLRISPAGLEQVIVDLDR
jgi:drug/metabolite transporter (DMT)-like permease